MEDTAENRLKAISDRIYGGDDVLDVDAAASIHPPKTLEEAQEIIVSAAKIIGDVGILAHGYVSKCCKGKGRELMEGILESEK